MNILRKYLIEALSYKADGGSRSGCGWVMASPSGTTRPVCALMCCSVKAPVPLQSVPDDDDRTRWKRSNQVLNELAVHRKHGTEEQEVKGTSATQDVSRDKWEGNDMGNTRGAV